MFKEYQSYDEMIADMQAAEAHANEMVEPCQAAMLDDSSRSWFWFRPMPEIGLIIFGKAYSDDECEKLYVDCGGTDADEAAYERESRADSRRRGYMFCRAYSVACPEGEYGDTHVSTVCPIEEDLFDACADAGWVVEPGTPLALDIAMAVRAAGLA